VEEAGFSRKFVSMYGDVLVRVLLGEGGLKIMTELINTILDTGEWPKDFTGVNNY